MTRGRSRSAFSLHERREKASELFLKGFSVSEVARRINVSWDTAKGYKAWHEERVSEHAQQNPQLLSDVLRNTVEMLAELDQVRAAAWKQYHTAESRQIKLQALNTIRSAQQDKARLFGLFGVKQDVMMLVTSVKAVQDRILSFLTNDLCEVDRRKLEVLLMSPELQQYMGLPALPVLEAESEEIELAEVG